MQSRGTSHTPTVLDDHEDTESDYYIAKLVQLGEYDQLENRGNASVAQQPPKSRMQFDFNSPGDESQVDFTMYLDKVESKTLNT